MVENDPVAIPPRVKDLTGQMFGRWTVLEYAGSNNHGHATWKCQCECGTVRCVVSGNLVHGNTISCGCLNRERTIQRSTTHGLSHSNEYSIWLRMRHRCEHPSNNKYKDYGGRGITLCNEWHSFEGFYRDMGPRPSALHTIERIDNDGNYESGNCRWATRQEQSRNTRRNKLLEFGGLTLCVSEWSERIGIPASILYKRLYRNWSIERALTTPIQTHRATSLRHSK